MSGKLKETGQNDNWCGGCSPDNCAGCMGEDEGFTMPFSGHEPDHLMATLKSITESSMPAEIFDAFLSEYAKTKDLDRARAFAMCEWDC